MFSRRPEMGYPILSIEMGRIAAHKIAIALARAVIALPVGNAKLPVSVL